MCKITVVCTKSRFTCAAYIYIYILKNGGEKHKIRVRKERNEGLMAKKRGSDEKKRRGRKQQGGQFNMIHKGEIKKG